MSRPLRLQIPGGIYHVTARGNARRPIFEDDDDCARFLIVLASTVARYRVLCHAYCLMGNHYHLLVQTPEPNLSLAMRQLNGVYTQRNPASRTLKQKSRSECAIGVFTASNSPTRKKSSLRMARQAADKAETSRIDWARFV